MGCRYGSSLPTVVNQMAHRCAGEHEAKQRRHVADGAVGRTGFIIASRARWQGWFVGIHGQDALGDVELAQAGADLSGQAATVGLADVGEFGASHVQPVASAHAGGNGDITLQCGGNQHDFAGHSVDTVNYVINSLWQAVRHVFRGEESLQGVDVTGGVDVRNACAHDVDFGLPHGGMQCGQLTVDVAGGDAVIVYQSQFSYAGTCQCVGALPAYATQARHQNVCLRQTSQCVVSHHDGGAFKLLVGHEGAPGYSGKNNCSKSLRKR